MENKKDIGKLFKDNLSQLDYSPSEMVWDKIETDLKKEKKNRRFFFWIFFSSILIIGSASYSYYHFNSVNEKTNNGTISTALNSNTNQNNNTVSNSSKENTTSNNNQNNNIILNNAKENVVSNNNQNNNTNSNATLNNFNSNEKSDLKFNLKNSKTNIGKTNTTKNPLTLTSNTKSKNSKRSIDKTNVTNNSLVANTNRTKENSRHTNNKNSKRSKSSLRNSAKSNFYSATNKTSKKRSNNLYQNQSKHSNLNSSSLNYSTTSLNGESLVNSQGINISEIDSCCSDENCIVIFEKIQQKPEKKKLPKTEEDSVVKPKNKTFIISPFAGFNSNYKIGEENKYGNSEVIDSPRKYGNLFGLKLKWMFSEKTGIQSGVSINTFYYNTTIKKSTGGLDTESIELNQQPSTLNSLFSNSEKVTFQQHLKYVEIPIEAYHYFNTSKLNHAASAGISFYLPIKNEVYAYSENVNKINIGKSVAYLKQGYGLNLNYYLNYNLSNKFQIFISPAAQFQFLGNIDYNQSTSYSFSISTGINYKL